MTALEPDIGNMDACPLGDGHEHHAPGWCCGAKLRRDPSKRCKRRAGQATGHVGAGPCDRHLGLTPSHNTAAQRTLAARVAAASLAEQGYEPIDPARVLDELLDLAGRVKGHVEFFSAKAAELGDGMRYRSEHEQEQLRSEMALLERFIDRLHRILTDLAKLNLEERRTALVEADRERVAGILVTGFDGLFALLGGHVGADVLEGLRRDAVPGVVRAAIEATGRDS